MATVHSMNVPGERVAIVAGLRTPFARQLTACKDLNAINLGVRVTNEWLSRFWAARSVMPTRSALRRWLKSWRDTGNDWVSGSHLRSC